MLDIGGGVIFQPTTVTKSGPLVIGTRGLHSLHASNASQPKSSFRATVISTGKASAAVSRHLPCSGTGIGASSHWGHGGLSSAMVPDTGDRMRTEGLQLQGQFYHGVRMEMRQQCMALKITKK